ncbi:MAG: LamG domain-containing protein, partial [Armatimonadota bacterium]
MSGNLPTLIVCALIVPAMVCQAADGWWNDGWRFRTSVTRSSPWLTDGARIVETDADLQALLDRAGVQGTVAPESIRVIDPVTGRQVQRALRSEWDPRSRSERQYLTWRAEARAGEIGRFDVYFDTEDRGLQTPPHRSLPPEELLANGGFEEADGDLPAAWTISEPAIASLSGFEHTVGERSLRLHVDAETPEDVERTVAVSQRVDVREYAGQEIRFASSLFPERGFFGTPVTVELVQFRADGSRIPEYAIQPRWMTVEMSEGQRVEFAERGKISPEAATVEVNIRLRLYARDAWDGTGVTDEEKEYICWIDRVSLRPGERWSWPADGGGCLAEGAFADAAVNRGVEFRGQRRLAFNGGSEATLTGGKYNPDQRSVHWGPQRGTLEMWVRPHWSSADDGAWTLFAGRAFGHRIQSQLRVVGGDAPALEFSIADSDRHYHTVRGPVEIERDRWYHVAATWDMPRAHLQIFLDGEPVASEGPGDESWPSTMDPQDPNLELGRGIMDSDRRSLPMQAYIGGDTNWGERGSAEAVIDEVRISDVVRYPGGFEPPAAKFEVDDATRALFHLDGDSNGIHSGDDRFVQGYLGCEHQPRDEAVALEMLVDGAVERRMVTVAPHAPDSLYERNRAHAVLQVTRPIEQMPDPRFVEHRPRSISATVMGDEEPFELTVGGDLEPVMLWSRFGHPEFAGEAGTLIPRWRANDNVVPFSFASLRETLAPHATTDVERALEIFRYALKATNYYDAHYCEDLGTSHRDRVSYTLIRALNVYPFDQCGPLNHTLRYLFIAGGISSNNAPGTHHQFQQGFYDGSLRLFDLSARQYWLGRDNETLASLRELSDDPWLKLRQEGQPNAWLPGRISSASFGSISKPLSIDVPLRPDERISFGWHNEGSWMALTGAREPIHPAKEPPLFGN